MSASIRTFRAPDARSALAAVKAALGSEAIILSTREVPGGLFKQAEIEVTAAKADATPSAKTAASRYAAHMAATSTPSTDAAEGAENPPSRQEMPVLQTKTKNTKAPAAGKETLPPRQTTLELSENLNHLRGLLEHPFAAEVYREMCDNGMEENLAESLVQDTLVATRVFNAAALKKAMRARLQQTLPALEAPWAGTQRRIMSLVGPTGVGKTTTMAKIAARALLESNRKVALITVDTYRIGASEQVARYGQIMNLPTYVAKNATELARAIERCQNVDLILIDTAGRSVSEAVAKQAELIRTVPAVEMCLVLSAATGARELAHTSERYKPVQPDRLIMTKVDEAFGTGAMLSPLHRLGTPITAIADGQRVPEDLHIVDSATLSDMILGLNAPTDRNTIATGR